MHTIPKNKRELAEIIAAERSQAEIKAVEIAYDKLKEYKQELLKKVIKILTRNIIQHKDKWVTYYKNKFKELE